MNHTTYNLQFEVPTLEHFGSLQDAEVEVGIGVPADMRPYREEALDEASSLPASKLERVIFATAVVHHVASNQQGSVLGRVCRESR